MDEQLVALATELVRVQEQKDLIEAREAELKDLLRKYGIGDHDAGEAGVVDIGPNRRLDPELVEKIYPPDQNPTLYKRVPNPKALRRVVAEVVYESMMVEVGKPKVTMRAKK